MGLHREIRRLRRLGITGFAEHHYRRSRLAVLSHTIILFDNWREVRTTYRTPDAPVLRFRRGFTAEYTPSDDPITISRDIFIDRCYQRHIKEPAQGVIVDVGANIGLVSLDWATRLPDIVIHAYEPDPMTFRTLQRNVEANGFSSRVRLFNEAVGERAGTLSLYRIGNSALTTAYVESSVTENREPVTAPMVSFENVIERAVHDGPIALVKIDVEGSEVAILEGASRATLAGVPQYVLEYHDGYCPNARVRCEKVLAEAGFRCAARPSGLHHTAGQAGMLYASRDRARRE